MKVAVAGLNTTINSFREPDEDYGHLVIGNSVMNQLSDKLSVFSDPPDFVIGMGHHPLDWLSPKEHDMNVDRKIIDAFDLYLHGHRHSLAIDPREKNLSPGSPGRHLVQAGVLAQQSDYYRYPILSFTERLVPLISMRTQAKVVSRV